MIRYVTGGGAEYWHHVLCNMNMILFGIYSWKNTKKVLNCSRSLAIPASSVQRAIAPIDSRSRSPKCETSGKCANERVSNVDWVQWFCDEAAHFYEGQFGGKWEKFAEKWLKSRGKLGKNCEKTLKIYRKYKLRPFNGRCSSLQILPAKIFKVQNLKKVQEMGSLHLKNADFSKFYCEILCEKAWKFRKKPLKN